MNILASGDLDGMKNQCVWFLPTIMVWLLGSGLLSCQPQTESQQKTPTGNITWEPTQVNYASGFDIDYEEQYKILKIFEAHDTTRYLLIPSGTPLPDIDYDQVIHIPVQRVVTQSTTHLGLFDFAEADSLVIAVDETDFIYSSIFRERIQQGKIVEVGGGEQLDMERLISLSPDLLMVSGMPDTGLERYQKLIASGIPVLINTEWMEKKPLGETEWVKVIAALTNKETTVSAKFDQIVQMYDSLTSLTDGLNKKPAIITGSPYQGNWFVSGDSSYFSRMLRQAGSRWAWDGQSGETTIPLDFEAMYAYGLKADLWINPGQTSSLKQLSLQDARFADFKSFQSGQIYNNNQRLNSRGGNDYYESGVVNPHLILADLIHIFHPELLPEHELYYYQRIE